MVRRGRSSLLDDPGLRLDQVAKGEHGLAGLDTPVARASEVDLALRTFGENASDRPVGDDQPAARRAAAISEPNRLQEYRLHVCSRNVLISLADPLHGAKPRNRARSGDPG
jgi:hypothetical protein